MTTADHQTSIDPELFRSALGSFATGVTAVCARLNDGTPVGIAANSFNSVSLSPPLVSFCIARQSATWEQMQTSGRFAVSVLAGGQSELCRQLARKGEDRFADVSWSTSPSGNPVIDGTLAWFDCSTWARYDGGDHEIVVGLVEYLEVREPAAPALLFFRSRMIDM